MIHVAVCRCRMVRLQRLPTHCAVTLLACRAPNSHRTLQLHLAVGLQAHTEHYTALQWGSKLTQNITPPCSGAPSSHRTLHRLAVGLQTRTEHYSYALQWGSKLTKSKILFCSPMTRTVTGWTLSCQPWLLRYSLIWSWEHRPPKWMGLSH